MIKVVKFGGSSLASATQFAKVGRIITSDPERRYVVPSAPGKRNSKDTKVTDMLYACYALAENDEDFDKELKKIAERYDSIINGLNLKLSLKDEFEVIAKNFAAKAGSDYAASRGEYLNGIVMSNYLGYEFVDAAEVIFFDKDGNFDADKTDKVLSKRLSKVERAVVPGFYGSMPDGSVKTFSRGGSDITGSIVAKAVHATAYENWTDVSGFLIADPRIIDNPEPIKVITYRELRELSYMGASVLHEDAIYPARIANIPINIRNTNEPENPGTMITSEPAKLEEGQIIAGIAGSKDFTVITMYKALLSSERGFNRKMSGVLEDFDIPIEHIPSGVDTLSVVISNKQLGGKLEDILDEFERQLKPDHMEVSDDIALIATVGAGMSLRTGVSAKLFTALAEKKVNIRMIDQGSSEMNIIVGVENKDFEKAIRAIYGAFVS